MINVTVERSYGAARVKSRVTAPSIERAMRLAGEGARVVFPIDPEAFFGSAGALEVVENLPASGRAEIAAAKP